jgi:hypothetical protein
MVISADFEKQSNILSKKNIAFVNKNHSFVTISLYLKVFIAILLAKNCSSDEGINIKTFVYEVRKFNSI